VGEADYLQKESRLISEDNASPVQEMSNKKYLGVMAN